jgi:hypothetical protein
LKKIIIALFVGLCFVQILSAQVQTNKILVSTEANGKRTYLHEGKYYDHSGVTSLLLSEPKSTKELKKTDNQKYFAKTLLWNGLLTVITNGVITYATNGNYPTLHNVLWGLSVGELCTSGILFIASTTHFRKAINIYNNSNSEVE